MRREIILQAGPNLLWYGSRSHPENRLHCSFPYLPHQSISLTVQDRAHSNVIKEAFVQICVIKSLDKLWRDNYSFHTHLFCFMTGNFGYLCLFSGRIKLHIAHNVAPDIFVYYGSCSQIKNILSFLGEQLVIMLSVGDLLAPIATKWL